MQMEAMNRIAESVAESTALSADKENHDEALANVDEAVDNIIAAITVLEENLPLVTINGVPQRAARDAIMETLETAIKPYTADIVNALETFGG